MNSSEEEMAVFRNRRRDERGAMLVVTALSLVALLGFAGLVIDGGRAYSDHRQVQNSADAAALAGASRLNTIIHTAGADASVIRTEVQNSITANGTNGAFSCDLVDVNGNVLSTCPSSTAALPVGAAGVKVQATDDQATSFMKVVGINSFSAAADATAQVQELRGGTSPFMICGLGAAQGGQDPPLLVQIVNATTGQPEWVVNSSAVHPTNTTEYMLHDNNGPGSCGGGSNGFKGLVNPGNYGLPGYWDNDTGTRAGPVRQYLASNNACRDDLAVGCEIAVPICNGGNGETGTNLQLWCVAMGAFRITRSTNTEHHGYFIGGAVVTSGQGGGIPAAGEARVIKLSE
jgi:Flp pilus assembly protein TadG